MMKKNCYFIGCALMIVLLFTSCNSASKTPGPTVDTTAVPDNVSAIDKEDIPTIEITVPAAVIPGFTETDSLYKPNGEKIDTVRLTDDGYILFTLSKDDYDSFLQNIQATIDLNINTILDDTINYESIKSITYNDDMTEFIIKCKNEEYDKTTSYASVGLYMQAYYYQAVKGVKASDIQVDVKFVGVDDNELITEMQYKLE